MKDEYPIRDTAYTDWTDFTEILFGGGNLTCLTRAAVKRNPRVDNGAG